MPEGPLQKSFPKKLKLAKFVLIILLLALCVTGRNRRVWPLKHWTMYSLRTMPYPSDNVSLYEVHVLSSTGERYELAPWDLITIDRSSVVKDVIEKSMNRRNFKRRDQNRAYLIHLITQALPGVDFNTVEVWELTWQVEPESIPPLDNKNPTKEIMKDRFAYEES